MFESDIQHRQFAFSGARSVLTAAYERVRIRAAETKWKPNGNIARSGEPTLNLSS
jgi:hypothetical protein